MQLTVKALQGRECTLQVSEDEPISTLKRLVSEKLNVPVGQQRLLYKGKALAGTTPDPRPPQALPFTRRVEEGCTAPYENRLSDYNIGPDSKLNLVIKPSEKASPEEPPRPLSPQPHALWCLVAQVLARHFSTADAERVLEQLQKDYERNLRVLSLDDIERLASRLLHPSVAEAVEMGFLD
ncbi:ubiquitin-like protein 4A isoform X1 [Ornithorhynchus anatinus]|uniref:ubiquitin-like protein 4A isoform X1 n=1 Tax=Ornithorhynchus anatinus TaxID=9258 RepID=UPI0010A7F840|nr:ubiquitin-like protein 4A isoform X1 [Ornithorhynchus anatinus]